MKVKGWIIPLCLLVLTGLPMALVAAPNTAGEDLHKLFAEEWEYGLRQSPVFASMLGDRRFNDLWPEVGLDAAASDDKHKREVLARLDAIDRQALSAEDRINYDLFRGQYEMSVEAYPYGWHLLPVNMRGGIQTAHQIADRLRFSTVKDYEDWIGRMRHFPAYIDQTMELMREGVRTGRMQPRVIMERVVNQIDSQLVEDPADSLFFKPFTKFPDSMEQADRDRLRDAAYEAIGEHIFPAFRKFREFFVDEYLPNCWEKAGVWQFPKGQEFYAHRVRLFTTTGLTPQEVHELGLREVKRIRGEMKKVIKQVGFEGSFGEFLEFLRTDPQFYYDNSEDLLEGYRAISKRVDPELVKLFKTLPRMPYGVEPIPDEIAPDTTTAYYNRPAGDGSRAGTYFVNLYRPEVRPKYEMEALSIHEAVPGHHLQISLAMELGNLPLFRRFGGYTAFVEGWALYSESLGEEMGFYQDPYSKFGQLTYEMWRAVRLVVDTGMHSMQWSRQRAIDFFKENAAKSEHDIINEIDRYIGWPGQALAYKIGELKIKELRARATKKLGDKFDVRDFHDVVLGSGAVTLSVLEGNVDAWIARVDVGAQ